VAEESLIQNEILDFLIFSNVECCGTGDVCNDMCLPVRPIQTLSQIFLSPEEKSSLQNCYLS